jgi:hypothetical protein
MKGFKTLSIVIFVGSTALIAVILYLMHPECSHYGKEWQLCTSPEGYGTYPYCSVYSKYNESDLAVVERGQIGVPTPYSPCFTCPAAGISCEDHVNEVFTAAGISADQNATLGGFNLWDEVMEL